MYLCLFFASQKRISTMDGIVWLNRSVVSLAASFVEKSKPGAVVVKVIADLCDQ